ncbi:MAG: monovalent cation/H(+) antiporter subunit G [Candidatus Thiodiazotropha lotti]|uniref:Monovalent cation/H(+) antiporter subunit G n=1 Tax=Candidatus Thiodiazotropha lotti TaxID=2792787 RepID=A0A9E4MZ50_9GAMM|nr:monovalent cation/H(+) antiporter subunit G [Candidatus Thiodiazotropha lotti]ODB94672.1 Na+/H+ antiporter subunit G [Candidatus Thiodiazotropha endoloripes]MCG7931471.1 monovalent cation/H(+) antiporter subunit G [Candidatus Thiodiazotropha lotti]MCG7937833.1 monovalent cation/H(+) antiporter subunit G [Candidatus Thiodiazotropha lotti]MCG7981437.1 monovalent cation/H(+) antiporter subunit G [Candidatus Thiodiazotropha lotti]
MRLIADLFLVIGAAFTLFGAIGLIRMPDVYNRIQAGTKAVTLGSLCLLIGIALLYPAWWSKLLVIGVLILITNPLGSSTIARALLKAGVKPWSKATVSHTGEADR